MNFTEVKELARQLIEADRPRDQLFQEYSNAYHMKWTLARKEYWLRLTISPDPHNAIRNTQNILTTTQPIITVPHSEDQQSKRQSESAERMLRLIMTRAGEQRGQPIEGDAVHWAALDGIVALKVAKTADLAEAKGIDEKRRKRYKALAKRVPFLVDVLDPMGVHVARGPHGIDYVVDVQKKTVQQVKAAWGPLKELFKDSKPTKEVNVLTYWDFEDTWVWVEGFESKEIYHLEHTLEFIPYIIHSVGEPMLYGVIKSKAWDWQNLVLTMMASQVFALGNSSWVLKGSTAHQYSELDFSKPGTTFCIGEKDAIEPLLKDLITKDMTALYQIVSGMVEETTVSKYVFGRAPESTLAFASLNLLVQGGRIPIAPIQTGVGWALGQLGELILRWIKQDNEKVELFGEGKEVVIDPADIDEDKLEVKVELKPDLPQDRMQLANVAGTLTDKGLISRETAREMIPGLLPQDEEIQIWRERYSDLMGQIQMLIMQQKLTPQPQQQPQPGPEGAMPQQQPPPQPQTMPPPQGPQGLNPPLGMTEAMATGMPPEGQMVSAGRQGGPPMAEAGLG